MSKRTKSGAIAEEEKTLRIPTDLYEEILLLLPAKDLLICKCVCKVWLKLISSARFIQKHLYRSKTEEGIRILIPSHPDIIECFHYNYPNTEISIKIHYPLGISGYIARILGSCDGLICLVETNFYFCLEETESCKLALFNPSTRKSVIRTVDGINFKSTYCYWFGYHPSCGEYVLILGYYNSRDHVKVEVYKFSRNIKPVLHCSVCHHRLVFCYENIAVLLHGSLHWSGVCYNVDKGPCSVILKYDLHKDETNEIPVPGPGPCHNFSVGVIHGCLFAMLHKINELWIMKEYGVEQSWTKYTNIEGYDNWKISSPVGFCSKEDLILGNVTLDSISRLRLTKYNFRDGEVTLLKDYYEAAIHGSKPIVFVDSLVSPELIWGTE